jgi:hypothetical protein
LAYQDEFFANNPLDVDGNDEHALDFALLLSRLFRSALNPAYHSNTVARLMLSFPNACLVIARVSAALFPRLEQNLMLLLCHGSRETALGQILDSK